METLNLKDLKLTAIESKIYNQIYCKEKTYYY